MANPKLNTTGELESSQILDNSSFDNDLGIYMHEIVGSPDPVGSPSRRVFPLQIQSNGKLGPTQTERYDYGSAPIYYVGSAPVGTAEGATGWIIEKFDLTSSSNAKGLRAENATWSNRASETYS